MAYGDTDFSISAARFEALDALEQAHQWVSFLDARDGGWVGDHPYYPHLAVLWERGDTPFAAERLADLEPRQVLRGELNYDLYEEELEALGTPPF